MYIADSKKRFSRNLACHGVQTCTLVLPEELWCTNVYPVLAYNVYQILVNKWVPGTGVHCVPDTGEQMGTRY